MADGFSGRGGYSGILGGSAPLIQESQPVFFYRLEINDQGKITAREECGPQGRVEWRYAYDDKGHLTEVRKNDLLAEYYQYDEGGRRSQDFRAWAGERRLFTWYYDGTLVKVNALDLEWTDQGQLAAVTDQGRRAEYAYGHDTRLDCVTLPDGKRVRYEYGRELMPVKVLVNGAVVAEYSWQDKLLLVRAKDIQKGLDYEFHYGQGRVPEHVTIRGKIETVYRVTGVQAAEITLDIWADQVGSIRVLSTSHSRPVKCLEYDSFGNITSDTRPEWPFPLSFACGLHDPYTGFVRFGFRDYDPRFGRFTAKDPALDLRGDGDLWDYCVDDPVGGVDPSGLIAWVALPLAAKIFIGKAAATTIAGVGAYSAAKAVDAIGNNKKASDALKQIAPYVQRTQAFSTDMATGGPAKAIGKDWLRGVMHKGISEAYRNPGKHYNNYKGEIEGYD